MSATVGEDGPERLRRRPDFVRFWSAETVSSFGAWISMWAIPVLVVQTLDAGSTGVGLVNAARWLPYLVLGVVVGVLIDRARRKPVLITTDLLRGLILVMVPVLALTDRLDLVSLVVLMVIFGTASIVNDAATQSFLPRLVPPRLITRANARLDSSDAVAQTTGPALAGGLVSLIAAPFAVLVNAVTFLASALFTSRIEVLEPPRERRRLSVRGVVGEAGEGLRWVYRRGALAPLAIGTHLWFVFQAMLGAVLPVYALQTLGMNALGFGLVTAAGGIGALTGTLLATPLGARVGVGRVVIISWLGSGLALLVMALAGPQTTGWLVFAAGQLLHGLAMGIENANTLGYRQALTPDRLQGRVNASIRSINRGMIVIAAPLGGVLGDQLGVRPVLGVAAAGFALLALAIALTPFRSARMPE